MSKKPPYKKYFLEITKGKNNDNIITNTIPSTMNNLLFLLDKSQLTRKEILRKTQWSKSQLENHLYKGKKKGIIVIENKKISINKK